MVLLGLGLGGGVWNEVLGAFVGEFVWKTLCENDSRPFIFQKEIFLKEIYLSYGFVVWVWVEGSRMKYWEPLWVICLENTMGKPL